MSGTARAQQSGAPRETDPPVPPGERGAVRDGVRVALVDSGVDYTLPPLARALARHDDGTLIGYDFWDMDRRPFDRHPGRGGRLVRHGTKTASILVAEAPDARLVPYRYPRPDMRRMTTLVAHAAANGVRVVGLPLGGNERGEWDAFETAARAHPDILFVASAGNDGRDIDTVPVWPAALPLDNLVVVTSADDFGGVADGVNRGRASVDYLVPAENVPVTRFGGAAGTASGSSYAVPRVVALAARLLAAHPDWRAPELLAELRRRFADGSHPRDVALGAIVDPLAVGERVARVTGERMFVPGGASEASSAASSDMAVGDTPPTLDVPLDVLVPTAARPTAARPNAARPNAARSSAPRPNGSWSDARIDATIERAARILDACALRLAPVRVLTVDAPERLADLSTPAARTLFDAVRASGPERRATLVLARDTRMSDPYDGEAFGRGNTARRPWLTDSVWLTAAVDDAGIALAHELFHVLANSGVHDPRPDNLMQARTRGDNVVLDAAQCEVMRETALGNGLVR